jgi:SAM-dependent methyltransferase
MLHCPAEHLAEATTERFDVTLSNAVLEHVFDPLRAAVNLHRVTAPGGIGFHQVDFRDHRDFTRPLEYLLLDEFSYVRMFHGSTGNAGIDSGLWFEAALTAAGSVM